MKVKNILGIDCSQSVKICDKVQYGDAGTLEKLKWKIHLFFCRKCQEYNRSNKKLSALLKKAGLKTCTEQEKNNFKKRMQDNS